MSYLFCPYTTLTAQLIGLRPLPVMELSCELSQRAEIPKIISRILEAATRFLKEGNLNEECVQNSLWYCATILNRSKGNVQLHKSRSLFKYIKKIFNSCSCYETQMALFCLVREFPASCQQLLQVRNKLVGKHNLLCAKLGSVQFQLQLQVKFQKIKNWDQNGELRWWATFVAGTKACRLNLTALADLLFQQSRDKQSALCKQGGVLSLLKMSLILLSQRQIEMTSRVLQFIILKEAKTIFRQQFAHRLKELVLHQRLFFSNFSFLYKRLVDFALAGRPFNPLGPMILLVFNHVLLDQITIKSILVQITPRQFQTAANLIIQLIQEPQILNTLQRIWRHDASDWEGLILPQTIEQAMAFRLLNMTIDRQ